MKQIALLVPEGEVAVSHIEGALKVFDGANEFLVRQDQAPLFHIQLVGLNRDLSGKKKIFRVIPDRTIREAEKSDLIIIPALQGFVEQGGDPENILLSNKEMMDWIVQQYRQGAEVASLCVGAFLLASTGLLKGRSCTTHWRAANAFRTRFPDIKLLDEKIITDEKGIYSSGGAYCFLNLLLYLVEKYAGREAAVYCSKIFAIEIERDSQAPYLIFRGQMAHTDETVKKAQAFIEGHYQDKITVEQLSSLLALSRRNLERRFRKATAHSVAQYIQRVKIEAAKTSLESSRENVQEVMYKVGYTDVKAFRTVFKKLTGLSPTEYRNKYNREGRR